MREFQDVEIEWDRLISLRKKVADEIERKLRKHSRYCGFRRDDIMSAVDGQLLYLVKKWNPDRNGGSSLTTYCYAYLEKRTYAQLLKEYRRARNEVRLEDVPEEDAPAEKPGARKAYAEARRPSFDRRSYFESLASAYEAAFRLDKATGGRFRYADLVDFMKNQTTLRLPVSLEAVAGEFGISDTAAQNRLAKLREETEKGKTE